MNYLTNAVNYEVYLSYMILKKNTIVFKGRASSEHHLNRI